jgi:hypothetical protein
MMNTYSCKGAKPNLASVVFNAPTRALGEKTTISPQKTTHNRGLFAVTPTYSVLTITYNYHNTHLNTLVHTIDYAHQRLSTFINVHQRPSTTINARSTHPRRTRILTILFALRPDGRCILLRREDQPTAKHENRRVGNTVPDNEG